MSLRIGGMFWAFGLHWATSAHFDVSCAALLVTRSAPEDLVHHLVLQRRARR